MFVGFVTNMRYDPFGVEGWTNTLPLSALKQISTAIPEVFISETRIVQRSGCQLKLICSLGQNYKHLLQKKTRIIVFSASVL